jgi:hypothetical protein
LIDGRREQARRERRPGDGLFWPLGFALSLATAGCTPRVEVVAPSEPITINLNIKLDADVRLRVEEKAKQDVQTKPIF